MEFKPNCDFAASTGDLALLQQCYSKGHPIGPWTLAYAAWKGHLHILHWLIQHHCKGGTEATRQAAAAGHTDAFMLLAERGYKVDEWSITYAKQRGHAELASIAAHYEKKCREEKK